MSDGREQAIFDQVIPSNREEAIQPTVAAEWAQLVSESFPFLENGWNAEEVWNKYWDHYSAVYDAGDHLVPGSDEYLEAERTREALEKHVASEMMAGNPYPFVSAVTHPTRSARIHATLMTRGMWETHGVLAAKALALLSQDRDEGVRLFAIEEMMITLHGHGLENDGEELPIGEENHILLTGILADAILNLNRIVGDVPAQSPIPQA